jgi:hypothetical protein
MKVEMPLWVPRLTRQTACIDDDLGVNCAKYSLV